MRSAIRALGLAVAVTWTLLLPGHGWARVAPWDIEKMPSSPAPAFVLPDLNGKQASSTSFKGQVLLINFWATWCAPCREEMPALDRLQQKFKAKGLKVIGVSIDSDKELVSQFIAQSKTSFPVLHDPEMRCHDEYKVFSYPTTFLVDRQGIIRKYWIGPQDWDGDAFAITLQEFLN